MTKEEWEEAERRYERQLARDAADAAEFDQWVIDEMYRQAEASDNPPTTENGAG